METNFDQNADNNQSESKNQGMLIPLLYFTGFIVFIILMFYGINWLIG